MRYDVKRNPNPDVWENTPIVEFHFVINDKNKPIGLNNIRHWRFVSWMRKVPTTLNNRKETVLNNIQVLSSTKTSDQSTILFRSKSKQSFNDRLYQWNIKLNTVMIKPGA